MKYPTHPLGLGPQAAFAGPRDVWDISFRMIPSSNIPDIQWYFVTRGCASHDKIPLNIGGNGGNITRFSVSPGEYCIKFSLKPEGC